MRAHEAVDIIVVMSKQIQETSCKSSLSIISMYHELSNPTYSSVTVCPAASKRVTSKASIYSNLHVRACDVIG